MIGCKNSKKKKKHARARDATSLEPCHRRWPSWVFVVPRWAPTWWWDVVLVVGCVAWWSWLGLTSASCVVVVLVVSNCK